MIMFSTEEQQDVLRWADRCTIKLAAQVWKLQLAQSSCSRMHCGTCELPRLLLPTCMLASEFSTYWQDLNV